MMQIFKERLKQGRDVVDVWIMLGEQDESRADAGLTVDREQRADRKRTVVVRDNGRLAG